MINNKLVRDFFSNFVIIQIFQALIQGFLKGGDINKKGITINKL